MCKDIEDHKTPPNNWTAIPDAYENRPFDESHAIRYLTQCYKTHKRITLSGFAEKYGWSWNKAVRFFRDAGVEIKYPGGKKHPKGGYLVLLPEDKLYFKTKDRRIIVFENQ